MSEKVAERPRRKNTAVPQTPRVTATLSYFEGVAASSIVAPVLPEELKDYYFKRGFFNADAEEVKRLDRFFERTEDGKPFLSGSAVIGLLNLFTNVFGEREVWDSIKPKIHFLRMEGEKCVIQKRFVGKSLVVYECFPAATRLYIHYVDLGLSDQERETLKRMISRAGTLIGIGAWIRRGFGRFRLL